MSKTEKTNAVFAHARRRAVSSPAASLLRAMIAVTIAAIEPTMGTMMPAIAKPTDTATRVRPSLAVRGVSSWSRVSQYVTTDIMNPCLTPVAGAGRGVFSASQPRFRLLCRSTFTEHDLEPARRVEKAI